MNCITSEEAKELAEWNQPGEVRSIYAVLQQLTDRRGKQGKRYSLALILTLLRLPKAAGETTLQAMAEWVRLRSAWLQETFPGIRPTFPVPQRTAMSCERLIPTNESAMLMSLLTRVRAEQRAKEEQRHVALDGKMDAGEPRSIRPPIKRRCDPRELV